MPPIQRQFLYSITVIKLQLFIEPPFYYYRVLRPFFCFLRLITLFGTTFCSSFPPARRDLPLPNLTAVPSSHDLPISRLSLSPAPGPDVFLPASRFFLHLTVCPPASFFLSCGRLASRLWSVFWRKNLSKKRSLALFGVAKIGKTNYNPVTKYDFVTF